MTSQFDASASHPKIRMTSSFTYPKVYSNAPSLSSELQSQFSIEADKGICLGGAYGCAAVFIDSSLSMVSSYPSVEFGLHGSLIPGNLGGTCTIKGIEVWAPYWASDPERLHPLKASERRERRRQLRLEGQFRENGLNLTTSGVSSSGEQDSSTLLQRLLANAMESGESLDRVPKLLRDMQLVPSLIQWTKQNGETATEETGHQQQAIWEQEKTEDDADIELRQRDQQERQKTRRHEQEETNRDKHDIAESREGRIIDDEKRSFKQDEEEEKNEKEETEEKEIVDDYWSYVSDDGEEGHVPRRYSDITRENRAVMRTTLERILLHK